MNKTRNELMFIANFIFLKFKVTDVKKRTKKTNLN